MTNVDFILCATESMQVIFKEFPDWMLLPTFRTFMTFAVFLVGFIISYLYKIIATVIKKVFMDHMPKGLKQL
jgi:uncharacterized membrane protein